MRNLVLILIVFIALVTFIRAWDHPAKNQTYAGQKTELSAKK